jgi:hypothetical protein
MVTDRSVIAHYRTLFTPWAATPASRFPRGGLVGNDRIGKRRLVRGENRADNFRMRLDSGVIRSVIG